MAAVDNILTARSIRVLLIDSDDMLVECSVNRVVDGGAALPPCMLDREVHDYGKRDKDEDNKPNHFVSALPQTTFRRSIHNALHCRDAARFAPKRLKVSDEPFQARYAVHGR